jgi:hypothetical protein
MSLKMSQKSRQEILEQARERYERRGRRGRSRLLAEVCALCGYERKHAIKVLSGRRAIVGHGGQRGGSSPVYGEAERAVLKKIWLAAEQPCGKRLVAALPVWLPYLALLREALRQTGAGPAAAFAPSQRGQHRPVAGPVPCPAQRTGVRGELSTPAAPSWKA